MQCDCNRKAMRLKNFDYSFHGSYFVTICCQNRQPLFGKIDNHKMINKWWHKIPKKFPTVNIGEFVTMPDHFHAIVSVGSTPCGRPGHTAPSHMDGHMGPSIQKIIAWFKTMTTNEYIRNVKNNNWQPFNDKLWQRSYHDRFIRNKTEYYSIKEYIINNPRHHK
ncbi:transposase [Candidatus Uhrbacteria bacterium]|nr:transposase [Candidatus Uhrbacteria bacterium]